MSGSLDDGYFDRLYADKPDPWDFATSDYEAGKYAHTVASLPREHYERGLEVGCSIGVLSGLLAPRCGRLLSLDVTERALAQARARNAGVDNVEFRQLRMPEARPEGTFDLIVLSEVLYYLDRADLARMAARCGELLAPDGDVMLVHWLGETGYPLTGDEAADGFIAAAAPFTRLLAGERREKYRLDVLRRA